MAVAPLGQSQIGRADDWSAFTDLATRALFDYAKLHVDTNRFDVGSGPFLRREFCAGANGGGTSEDQQDESGGGGALAAFAGTAEGATGQDSARARERDECPVESRNSEAREGNEARGCGEEGEGGEAGREAGTGREGG